MPFMDIPLADFQSAGKSMEFFASNTMHAVLHPMVMVGEGGTFLLLPLVCVVGKLFQVCVSQVCIAGFEAMLGDRERNHCCW